MALGNAPPLQHQPAHQPDGQPALSNDPLWYKDAVIYQLHIKSYFDANNDGVGDFAGLEAKLDYIVELGVDTIWLLPFYPSPRLDDGYDIADYRGVHPDYGNLKDAKRFIQAAHDRGLRVITELVINHTSDQYPWFQRARNAPKGSKYRDWYVWSDTKEKYLGTRVIFCDTEPSNWTWDPVAEAFYWHRFYAHQPDLNFNNPAVLKEIFAVMRYWLDLGVDGLRLDAVPYLIEREGTSCENLPETHAVLKAIRAALDEKYSNRLLLAEANQWPEDVQEYFGQGDECHMAFHFPLMPRMYMAIAQEDRFPITDIMRQTPAIPDNCQWAIFLRNHDELTLEMVTDAERDYLWQTYASDKRARLNLGIRRRLAPLLERDRRRIELLNSLLLTMPGTPVIYYGDEIGMGDNIHLGDRDGVRTPMQWSPDRNGGFSRADPEQLVLPSIMGTLYGFESVNVESQSRDPHSLLNWMRRMLATRKQHKAFGRGTIRFLHPSNRKVLAYLREWEGETLLCVANLSRAPQAVELDLSEFSGRVPVEMGGNSVFPPIGQLTYLLTLPPYGFYWLQLSVAANMPSWYKPAPEQMPELTTMVVRRGIEELRDPQHRTALTQEILPVYLPRRRWFASKDVAIGTVRMADTTLLTSGDRNLVLAEVEVGDPAAEARYLIPLALVWDNEVSRPLPQQLALARVRFGRKIGLITDAFSLELLPVALLEALRSSQTVLSREGGEVRFIGEPGLDAITLSSPPAVRWIATEQSNSSVLIEETAVIKIVRRIRPGLNPQTEMSRHLTTQGFKAIPELLGEIVKHEADGVRRTMAIVERYVHNEGDAWAWTLSWLQRSFEPLTLTEVSEDNIRDAFAGYALTAAAIGRRLAEMHVALAADSDDPAFAPAPATKADIAGWVADVRKELDQALALLGSRRVWPDAETQAAAGELLAAREALYARLDSFEHLAGAMLTTRIHGDFHLGQILVVAGDVCLIDFEGEPGRSLAARRAKSSPLRDVAGLLRSLHYAALSSATAQPEAGAAMPRERSQLRQKLTHEFHTQAQAAFLNAYREVAAAAERSWYDEQSFQPLIDLFLLGKAAYEVQYEAESRPAWIGLPIEGLLALVRSPAIPATQEAVHAEV